MTAAFRLGGGGQRGHRARQRVGGHLEPVDLVAADRALDQVADEAGVLLVGQGAQHVRADVLLVHLVAFEAHAGSGSPTMVLRSFSRPRRMRPLTVPIGISSWSAIWLWEKPPK